MKVHIHINCEILLFVKQYLYVIKLGKEKIKIYHYIRVGKKYLILRLN